MKCLMFFLSFAVVISAVLASGSDPDWQNGEIVRFDVYADSDASEHRRNHNSRAELSASASVQAESGSDGWYNVWAEAGSDRKANHPDRDYQDSGSYLAGNNGFSASKYAHSVVGRFYPDWGYIFRDAHINSQDDEDFAPK